MAGVTVHKTATKVIVNAPALLTLISVPLSPFRSKHPVWVARSAVTKVTRGRAHKRSGVDWSGFLIDQCLTQQGSHALPFTPSIPSLAMIGVSRRQNRDASEPCRGTADERFAHPDCHMQAGQQS